jgi:DNA helicase-2/ATP-dependent DNA helicase PcrA
LSSIETYLEQLNDKQKEAVLENSAPLLVLAGAGSGKTRVITTKIAYAIECLGIAPWQILAVTFTNKAAKEMRERVSTMVPSVDVSSMHIRTFHSFGAWLLRVEGKHIGLDPNFAIYDDQDSLSLLSGLYPNSKKAELSPVAKAISLAKDMMLFPDSPELESVRRGEAFSRQFEAYEKRLREVGNVDFADLICRSIELLSPDLPVASHMHNRFKMILVDEYQDSNIAQFQLLKALVGPESFVCVVGDDDQSIYRFRGAKVEHILTFPDQFPGTKIVKLEQNYRSTGEILSIATSVIAHNRGRHEKVLWTANPSGPKPKLLYVDDEKSEAIRIAREIRKDKKYDSSAIIYRTNAQSLSFETLFQKERIPYKVIGALRFYDREEIKDSLALLFLMLNPYDEVHFKRMINKPSRGLGPSSVDKILFISEQEHVDYFQAIAIACEKELLKGKAAQMAKQFALLFSEAFQMSEKGNSVIVEYLVRESGLLTYYKNVDEKNHTEKLENIEKLINTVGEYASGGEGLIEFLESLTLDPTTLGTFDPASQDGVSLITMHNTKGLEFDRVFVTGLEENLFPSRSCESDEDFEEERRLFYVAVTRARKELYITSCQRRMIWGKTNFQIPSRYLKEIPKELLQVEGRAFTQRHESYNHTESQGGYHGFGSLEDKRQRKESLNRSNIIKSVHTFAAKKAQRVQDDKKFSLGMRVLHESYGEGEVQSINNLRGREMVEVRFDNGKKATFFSSSGVLEIVSSY